MNNEDITFLDFMYSWLETSLSSKSIEPNTYESYSSIIKLYIKPYFNDRKITLQELKPKHIQDYYDGLLLGGLSGNTILKIHANVRTAANMLFEMGHSL